MDIAILISHLITSLFFLSFLQGVIIVFFTALWYVFIDRFVLNFLIAILMRVSFKPKGDIYWHTFFIEIIKAPVSAGLGGYFLFYLFRTSSVYVPFGIGLLFWAFNFHFIGGVFKNHPHRTLMYIGVFLLTTFTIALLPEHFN